MLRRNLLPAALVVLILSSLINWGCSKLDTTDVGSDLIPAVDNVHTFADTLDVITSQGVFNDTTLVSRTEDHVLGKITGDPMFGQTTADVYMQLKPTFYPFYFGAAKDTINNSLVPGTGFDSVILCINYKGFWGDSTQPINLQVRTVNQNNGVWDSLFTSKTINFAPTTGSVIGSASVDVRALRNYTKYANHRDSSVNQIRIRLNQSGFESLLYSRDTIIGSPNSAFRNDSLFRLFNNGLAVMATNGNGLMYCNLADTNTKVEVHYRRRNGGTIDTVYSSFKLATSVFPSATANHIVRARPATISSPPPGELYLQTTPGTYVDLQIPALSTMPNRIIHRAELIIKQIPTNPVLDDIFSAPSYVYLDLKDTGALKWKPIYYDLNPNETYFPDAIATFSNYYPSSGVDLFYYGGFRRDGTDRFGNGIKYYNINMSRYVQNLVTRHTNNYAMRLYAPSYVYYPQVNNSGYIQYNNLIAKGRVKVGSGTNPDYKMILRVVYSNL